MIERAPIAGPVRQGVSAAEPWLMSAVRTTAEDLSHLAFHGHAEHVRALFETLTPAERARHAEPAILRQVVLGSLARLRALPAGPAVDRHRELEFLETAVQLLVSECRHRSVFQHELFSSLLDWSGELLGASRLLDARDTCDLALTLGVHAYPRIWPWIRLRKARVQMLLGDLEAAYTTLFHTYQRLDRIADRNAVPPLLDALGTVSLETRRAPLFRRLLVDRLRVFHTNADERRAIVNLMQRAHRGPRRLLASRELSVTDKLLWLTHWICLGAARHIGWRPVAGLLETCATASAYVHQYGWGPHPVTGLTRAPIAIEATLVTRAMGGLGDFLMMTPGLHALKAMRTGQPIILAIPRRFFPLFDGNDDVQLMDIDANFDPATYKEWLNLTDCPAARVESRRRRRSRPTVSICSPAASASPAGA